MVVDSAAARRLLPLADDLTAEQRALDSVVGGLGEHEWELPTPATGWSVADQVSHLAYFDSSAALALTDRAGFEEHRAQLFDALAEEPDVTLGQSVSPAELLSAWREGRSALL